MASGPTTSWQINGKTMETVIIFLGSKIIANDDFSHEIKRLLLLGRNAMSNLDSLLKSRGITLPKSVCIFKIMVFAVVMCGCESWTIKKAEHRRINVSELVKERTFESPLDMKEIKPVNPEVSRP